MAVIFQPAEEGGGGGNEMVKDGMMERFAISKVFGMHNMPGLPVGQFAIRPGPIMAATAEFTITVKGRGGHAAMPHGTIDPIVITSQLVGALQTVASRSTDPVEAVVVSVTKFHAGDAYNVIPESAEIAGTVRTLKKEDRQEVGGAHPHHLRGAGHRLRRDDRRSTTTPTTPSPSITPKRRSLPAISRPMSPATPRCTAPSSR